MGADKKVEILSAEVADVDAIGACVDAAYGHYVERMGMKPGPMLDDYAEMIREHSVWVVRDAGAVAGLLVLIDKPDMLLLDNVAVHPGWQGRGIGKALMQFAEAEAKRRGYGAIQLYTHELMVENIALYQRIGYEIFERRKERGFERVYMKLQWTDMVAVDA